MSFWEVLWLLVISFAFIAYLMVLLNIVTDLFRDPDTSGVVKAVWFVALIVLPFLAAVLYLVFRGRGMASRQQQAVASAVRAQDDYIRSVAGTGPSPAEQIDQAHRLRESGTISADEFESLKAKALG
ncbi:MAG TPA: SHOCT domain-containing protein [Dermatophilaceae bacterium]|nr:SHOCT domain-containing protein [Dermatophilaceae bacterium]